MSWSKLTYLGIILSMVFVILIGRLWYSKSERVTLKEWFSASLVPIAIYLVWDILVTDWWWQFSVDRTLNLRLLKLPISEYLFFIVVSYGCLQIWKSSLLRFERLALTQLPRAVFILSAVITVLGTTVSMLAQLWYTSTVLGLSAFMLLQSLRSKIHRSLLFIVFVLITWGLTVLFNTLLTAIPVVTYAASLKSGYFIGTIPIEDFGYIYPFIWGIIYFYQKSVQHAPAPLTSNE